jgi:RND family efflux transporter MFP subunit
MLQRLRTLIIIGVLLIGLAAGYRLVSAQASTQSAGAAAAAATVEFAAADRGDIPIVVNAVGNIVANQNVALAFTTSAKVTAVNVKVGDYVKKGQTLATVDNQAFQDAINTAQLKVYSQQLALNKLLEKPRQVDIDVAQANLNYAKAALSEAAIGGADAIQAQIAQTAIDAAQNQSWQAQLNRDIANNKAAANPKAPQQPSTSNDKSIAAAALGVTVAQAQLNATLSQGANPGSIAAAQANVTNAQIQLNQLLQGPNADDLKQAQTNLDAAKAALAAAQQDLAKTLLVAPFDGQVAQVNLNIGQVAPSTNAVTLVDVSSFYVDLPIAELDIAKVQVGQSVNMRFDALPTATLVGTVTRIAQTPNTGTPVTYNVHVELKPVGQPLLSTMSTTASIVTSNAANVVRLPNRFIRVDRARNKAYATVQQADGTFKEVEVVLGTANDTYTEIKSGLAAGAIVTTPGAVNPQNAPNLNGTVRRLTGG